MEKIKVLVVDDSPVVRSIVSETLATEPRIDVVGCAEDPYEARDLIKKLNPDVLTLDVEMPKMDGITFLKNLMRLRPMPVVMLSSLTTKGSDVTLDALSLGAVDFIAKPSSDSVGRLDTFTTELVSKVLAAAKAKIGPKNTPAPVSVVQREASAADHKTVIAIGASTGGTEAIAEVLSRLPGNLPPVVITQHIPPKFSERFALRLDGLSELKVCEAKDGQMIRPGHAYVAPGDKHFVITSTANGLVGRLSDAEPVNRHKPSVDVMFSSLAELKGYGVCAVILTGMGKDGAQGMLELQRTGALTIGQDEATCVVYGMPKAAYDLGGVDKVVGLSQVADVVLRHLAVSSKKVS
ncbi:MAG: protein-glutamate methylesterase/protein-glutamine glutaminase [Pontibacterium sp.]